MTTLAATTKPLMRNPQPTLLAGATSLRREPVRPIEHRDTDFDAKFDFETLFYDAIAISPEEVLLVAPPLLNLAEPFAASRFVAMPSGVTCRARHEPLDRHSRIRVSVPAGTRSLRLTGPLGSHDIVIQPDETPLFAGRRVMFTQSKNNRLHWIQDWLRFGRDRHGADAVLIYDNGSTLYELSALAEAVQAVSGFQAAAIVTWPFRFGPQGYGPHGPHPWSFWDSDFGQFGAWEHARWRFLGKARSAQNSDIDELVLHPDNQSVFAAAEKDWFGIVRYPGRWVTALSGGDAMASEHRRHKDFSIIFREQWERRYRVLWRDALRCPPKWTVVPSRCPQNAQWKVHNIGGWWPALRLSRQFSFRHFRSISTNWRYERTDTDRYDETKHMHDDALVSAMASVDWQR